MDACTQTDRGNRRYVKLNAFKKLEQSQINNHTNVKLIQLLERFEAFRLKQKLNCITKNKDSPVYSKLRSNSSSFEIWKLIVKNLSSILEYIPFIHSLIQLTELKQTNQVIAKIVKKLITKEEYNQMDSFFKNQISKIVQRFQNQKLNEQSTIQIQNDISKIRTKMDQKIKQILKKQNKISCQQFISSIGQKIAANHVVCYENLLKKMQEIKSFLQDHIQIMDNTTKKFLKQVAEYDIEDILDENYKKTQNLPLTQSQYLRSLKQKSKYKREKINQNSEEKLFIIQPPFIESILRIYPQYKHPVSLEQFQEKNSFTHSRSSNEETSTSQNSNIQKAQKSIIKELKSQKQQAVLQKIDESPLQDVVSMPSEIKSQIRQYSSKIKQQASNCETEENGLNQTENDYLSVQVDQHKLHKKFCQINGLQSQVTITNMQKCMFDIFGIQNAIKDKMFVVLFLRFLYFIKSKDESEVEFYEQEVIPNDVSRICKDLKSAKKVIIITEGIIIFLNPCKISRQLVLMVDSFLLSSNSRNQFSSFLTKLEKAWKNPLKKKDSYEVFTSNQKSLHALQGILWMCTHQLLQIQNIKQQIDSSQKNFETAAKFIVEKIVLRKQ